MPFRSNDCFSPLLSDPATRQLFSTEATLEGMLRFEQALTRGLAACGVVERAAAESALAAMDSFQVDMAALSQGVVRDGLPVPEWTRQLKAHAGASAAAAIHIGATSQDLLDTSQSLALKQVNAILGERLTALLDGLGRLDASFGGNVMMGRTRMQAALPVSVSDRIGLWSRPLERHLGDLHSIAGQVELLQYAGPVGLRDMPAGRADDVAKAMAAELGLRHAPHGWHATRENIVSYGQLLARISGTLGKFGQDVALMAQQGIDEVRIAGGGTSSAMPHKQNPVVAETLVALAHYNAAQSGGLAQVLMHEQERSGTMWTLEWLLLPSMIEACGTALRLGNRLVDQIDDMGAKV